MTSIQAERHQTKWQVATVEALAASLRNKGTAVLSFTSISTQKQMQDILSQV